MKHLMNSSLRSGLAVTLCVGLGACVTNPLKEASEPKPEPVAETAAAEAPAPVPVAPPKIATPEEQQQAQRAALKVADILAQGSVEEAHVQIERALAIDPNNALAQSFLKQLTVDPVEALGAESFSYTVKPGETLSKIAGRFMGDIFQFYILARYNGIEIPRLVPAGQKIRVPGERPRMAAPKPSKPKTKAARPAVAEPRQAERVPTPEMPEAVVEEAAAMPPPDAAEVAMPEAVVAEPVSEEAVVSTPPPVVEQAPEMSEPLPIPVAEPVAAEPEVAIAEPLPPVEPSPPIPTEADRAFQRGLREQARGNNMKAYEAFREAYALDGSMTEARSNADLMHKEIIAAHTRRARAAFTRQDLQGSIEHWDSLLAFDPGNRTAQLERQKALNLQERIKSIK